jgi:cell shape-determining protein MreC
MDALTLWHWFTEHIPSLLGGGLLATFLVFYIQKKKLRSEIRQQDAHAASEETDTIIKQVGVTTSVIAIYKTAATDMAEKFKDYAEDNKNLRAQLKRRNVRIAHLEQDNALLREMKNLPPTESVSITD